MMPTTADYGQHRLLEFPDNLCYYGIFITETQNQLYANKTKEEQYRLQWKILTHYILKRAIKYSSNFINSLSVSKDVVCQPFLFLSSDLTQNVKLFKLLNKNIAQTFVFNVILKHVLLKLSIYYITRLPAHVPCQGEVINENN